MIPFIHWNAGYKSAIGVKYTGDTIRNRHGRKVRTPGIAREYLLGLLPPRYPVSAVRCDLVIWCADAEHTTPQGLSIIVDNSRYIEDTAYSYGDCCGYGTALANL